jgi:tRNA pseudouridine55 synthase
MCHGVLVLDKPRGMTSHDVVARVRRRLGTRKVGHAGTLDPDATGVLVLCIGDATRLAAYLTAADKEYEGRVIFGIATDTDDASGEVTARASAAALRRDQVEAAGERFVGGYEQTVPAYSAVHIDGRRAYDLARRGANLELPKRRVEIHRLELHSFSPGETAWADFTVACSKGTYIRALCRDWGAALGLPAHMGALRRIRSGRFHIGQALALADFEAMADPKAALLPMTADVVDLPRVVLDGRACQRLAQGQAVRLYPAPPLWDVEKAETVSARVDNSATARQSTANEDPEVAVCTTDGQLVAVAVCAAADNNAAWIRPRKVFWKKV